MVDPNRAEPATPPRRARGRTGMQVGLGLTVLLLTALAISAVMLGGARQAMPQPKLTPDAAAATARRVGAAFDAVQGVWRSEMERLGLRHEAPQMRYYTGSTVSSCSDGRAATGPFYCPRSVEAMFDLAFFEALNVRLRRNGDLGTALVVALVVALIAASHVQDELGLLADAATRRSLGADPRQVESELAAQADCLAGVWAALAQGSLGRVPVGFYDQLIGIARNIMEDHGDFAPDMPARLDPFAAASRPMREADFARGYAGADPEDCLPAGRIAG